MSQPSQPLIQDADDIQSLTQYLHTGEFEYVDIMSHEAWQRALKQWPLLAEWQRWSQESSS